MREVRVLAFAFALACGCSRGDEIEEIDRATARHPTSSSVPTEAVGAGVDETTGLPVGYPPNLPLVPDGRAVAGGVDPGAIRSATLIYEDLTVDAYCDALKTAVEGRGLRMSSDRTTSSGARRLRVDLGDTRATVLVSNESGRTRVDITMLERPPSN